MMLNALDRYRDAGLLLLRVGIGLSYIGYGAPKLSGGSPMWEELGQAMRYLGITFAPTAWGFLAAVSEFFGGLALVVGGLFRFATFPSVTATGPAWCGGACPRDRPPSRARRVFPHHRHEILEQVVAVVGAGARPRGVRMLPCRWRRPPARATAATT
jgi:hypothetical protein